MIIIVNDVKRFLLSFRIRWLGCNLNVRWPQQLVVAVTIIELPRPLRLAAHHLASHPATSSLSSHAYLHTPDRVGICPTLNPSLHHEPWLVNMPATNYQLSKCIGQGSGGPSWLSATAQCPVLVRHCKTIIATLEESTVHRCIASCTVHRCILIRVFTVKYTDSQNWLWAWMW